MGRRPAALPAQAQVRRRAHSLCGGRREEGSLFAVPVMPALEHACALACCNPYPSLDHLVDRRSECVHGFVKNWVHVCTAAIEVAIIALRFGFLACTYGCCVPWASWPP